MSDPLMSLVAVGLLSIGCQYFAYKVRLPAILPLLIVGILVGPVWGVLDADALFGNLLFPVVSLSVAIILFEGSLTLKFRDIAGHGNMVRNLCSIGVVVTWGIAAVAAHYSLNISWQLAFLFGAIVTVTGPTVIVPMLRTVRPKTNLANILRWEGIVIDPIGALLAVLVFEFIVASQGNAISHTFIMFGKTIGIGVVLGLGSGYLLGLSIRKDWIPHYLLNTAVLTIILGVFAASNYVAHESGLLAVTITGMVLANMKNVDVEDILEFKETLSVLLISGLFILLATRLNLQSVIDVGWGAIIILIAIMFVARPLAVIASSIGTGLKWNELALLSWIAPRGIVAAAVSALFSLKLEEIGYEGAGIIVPMVFLVIIATVVVQSLTSRSVASLLKVRAPAPTGYLIFGGSKFNRLLACEMLNQDIAVTIADTNWDAIREARMMDIPVYFGNPMSDHAARHLDIATFGTVLIMSPYKQLNPLISYHFEYTQGKDKVWSLTSNEQATRPSHQVSEQYAKKLTLFDEGVTYGYLASAVSKGASVKTTRLTDEFSFEDYNDKYNDRATPLLAINKEGKSYTFINGNSIEPKSGWRIISLVLPEEDK
ncbi:sodium:proton exchanger [Alteromonas australica]|uniref:Sodium:proton exchanger n=1 Tax=Alteromonas australica TaxID=589873 RepID=A0A075NY81_9ALTE|nr:MULTISPECIES: sodium:proton antiporter [Alteromonas]AIF97565.1 sodium:proton exchanger [Alteromonas australica]AJP42675.1 sodium:proton exchanger [Alteromonas australica]QPL49725.1 sodium:proton antiporter [Alteromonas sp. B31-7]HBF72400.1 sodium:proton exchanger [Alteromonas australica]